MESIWGNILMEREENVYLLYCRVDTSEIEETFGRLMFITGVAIGGLLLRHDAPPTHLALEKQQWTHLPECQLLRPLVLFFVRSQPLSQFAL